MSKSYCIFAANFIWPQKELGQEALVLVVHPDLNQEFTDTIKDDVISRNSRLPDYKRVAGYVVWDKDFPRTASMKIKRAELADEIRKFLDRSSAVKEL